MSRKWIGAALTSLPPTASSGEPLLHRQLMGNPLGIFFSLFQPHPMEQVHCSPICLSLSDIFIPLHLFWPALFSLPTTLFMGCPTSTCNPPWPGTQGTSAVPPCHPRLGACGFSRTCLCSKHVGLLSLEHLPCGPSLPHVAFHCLPPLHSALSVSSLCLSPFRPSGLCLSTLVASLRAFTLSILISEFDLKS